MYTALGGKKEVTYIANKFLPHLKKLDPVKTQMDIIFCDGAASVQKARQILAVRYPQVTVLHDVIEHCISLFFSDVGRIPIIRQLTNKMK